MNCDKVKSMQGAYLDSELDARTTLEIAVHLRACAECARLVAEEQALEARIRGGLSRGQRTPALWDQIEASVVAAAAPAARVGRAPAAAESVSGRTVLSALGDQVRAGWKRSRWAWCGLAGAWTVILVLNLTAREPEGPQVAEKRLPRASDVRYAVQQKQLLMADLAAPSEPAPAIRMKAAPPRPRSDRRRENLNA